MRRLPGLALRVTLSLLLFGGLLELSLRALQPVNASVRSWLAVPQDAFDFGRAATTAELLDMSVLRFAPFVDQSGFVTNSRGFRTAEYAREKAPGSFRVVALGDSFTFASGGVPWPELWTTRLAERLAAATPRPVELVNLGVPAVGPSFELRLWRLEGAELQADLVLLGLFVGNDFNDERWHVDGGAFSRWGRPSCAARLLRNLLKGRDPLPPGAHFEDEPARRLPAGTRGGFAVEGYADRFAQRAALYADEDLARIESRNMRICDRGRSGEFELLFGRVTAALRLLHADVAAAGGQLALVLIPARCQIDTAGRAAALAWAGQPETDFAWELPQQRLAVFLQAEDIPFLDLLPALRVAGSSQELYANGDTHWSPAGNAVVAERVAAWVASQGWPPGASSR